MANSPAIRQGWGNQQAIIQGAVTIAGNAPNQSWTVAPNIGVGVSVRVTDRPVRLSYIHARVMFLQALTGFVDYTPYRLIVVRGNVPPDISILQAAGLAGFNFGTQALELPSLLQGAGFDILDDWTYQNARYTLTGGKLPDTTANVNATPSGDEDGALRDGQRFEIHHRFGDGGPRVSPTDTLSVLWLPMFMGDAPGQANTNGAYALYMSLSVWGKDDVPDSGTMRTQSLPRYDFDTSREA